MGSAEQVEAGAKQLARRLEDKLLGPGASAQASGDVVGDFDAGEVKDAARNVARSLALRFPRLTGKLVNALPNGTASCTFDSGEPFKGEFFEISGLDEVTEQDTRKGYFLLSAYSRNGCSGRIKREAGGVIEDGDTLTSMPLKIGVEAVQAGPGTQPELASLLAERAARRTRFLPAVPGGDQSPAHGHRPGLGTARAPQRGSPGDRQEGHRGPEGQRPRPPSRRCRRTRIATTCSACPREGGNALDDSGDGLPLSRPGSTDPSGVRDGGKHPQPQRAEQGAERAHQDGDGLVPPPAVDARVRGVGRIVEDVDGVALAPGRRVRADLSP